jgi:hypothetical protein
MVGYLFVFGVAFVFWLVWFIGTILIASDISLVFALPSMSLDNLSKFGDSFNALTSLFAVLAFSGLLYSIKTQQDAIAIQKQAFESQISISRDQEFDNKFFQMLGFVNDIKKQLKEGVYEGSGVFKFLREEIERELKKFYSEDCNGQKKHLNQKIKYFDEVFNGDFDQEGYEGFNFKYEKTFKYYYLNFFQLIKYVDNNSPEEKRKFYADIVRTQLSSDELILLAYNAIGVKSFTTNKYQKFVEKYALLKHLSYSVFMNPNSGNENEMIQEIIVNVLSQYNVEAFGDNKEFIEYLEKLKNNYKKS